MVSLLLVGSPRDTSLKAAGSEQHERTQDLSEAMKMKMSRWSVLLIVLCLGAACQAADVDEGGDVENPDSTASAGAAAAANPPDRIEEGHVVVLDASNFSNAITQHDFLVVEFFAPSCIHCQQLSPIYDKAAALLQDHHPAIFLAKVDATNAANQALAIEHHVGVIPTLKIIQNGSERDYKGPHTDAESIASYLKKQAGPPSAQITSAEEGAKLLDDSELVVVGVFPSSDSEELEKFISIANELRSSYEFKYTLDANFLPKNPSEQNTISGPIVRILKNFDEGFHDFDQFDVDALKIFLDRASIPYVVLFNSAHSEYLSKLFEDFVNDGKVFLFVDAKNEGVEDVKTVYGELAKEYRGNGLWFLMADNESGQKAMDFFGAKEENLPSIAIAGGDDKKYMLEKVDASNMAAWLQDYLNGKVPEFLISEAVPEENDEPVKVVVADTLDSLVLRSEKNVLLEFYAPWCGHCKKLAPILEEVAVMLQSDPDVVIAKMDATANDIRRDLFEVQRYPTIYLHTALGKVIAFDGDLTKDGIIDFINSHRDAGNEQSTATTTTEQLEVEEDQLKDEL